MQLSMDFVSRTTVCDVNHLIFLIEAGKPIPKKIDIFNS